MQITIEVVQQLVKEQFPQWRQLDIYPVAKSGSDNRTFHLGDKMAVRLPRSRKKSTGFPICRSIWTTRFQNRLPRENPPVIIPFHGPLTSGLKGIHYWNVPMLTSSNLRKNWQKH